VDAECTRGKLGRQGVFCIRRKIAGDRRLNPDGTMMRGAEKYFLPEESSHRLAVFLPDENTFFLGRIVENSDDDPIS